MKAAFLIVIVASIAFAVFSFAMGQERSSTRVLGVVKPVSIAFYVLNLVVFSMASKSPAKRVKVTATIAVLVSIVMTLWSLMLSNRISFDEVFIAWVFASVILASFAAVGLKATKDEPPAS